MRVLGPSEIEDLAPIPQVIECLKQAFREGAEVPLRQVAKIPGGSGERLFLSMPAFDASGAGVVKVLTVVPENPSQGLPAIQSIVIVFTAEGAPVALLDGPTVTHLRTGAASALASQYLSRADSQHLVIVGTGALAPWMALAHCAVRPIRRVTVWGRRAEQAQATVDALRPRLDEKIELIVGSSLQEAVADADIVSCATSTAEPVLHGRWLKEGTFVDLVGSFSRTRREADDHVIKRSRLFVDTFSGALAEAGDLLDPIQRGVIQREQVEGELADLVCGRRSGRASDQEITLFKSVGTAIEDLAVSKLVVAAEQSRRSGVLSQA